MPFFNFVQNLLTSEFVVVARRYTLPADRSPVFATFIIRERNSYEAARAFDQTHTAWTRLSVTKKV